MSRAFSIEDIMPPSEHLITLYKCLMPPFEDITMNENIIIIIHSITTRFEGEAVHDRTTPFFEDVAKPFKGMMSSGGSILPPVVCI